jgi:hypothetical protein
VTSFPVDAVSMRGVLGERGGCGRPTGSEYNGEALCWHMNGTSSALAAALSRTSWLWQFECRSAGNAAFWQYRMEARGSTGDGD